MALPPPHIGYLAAISARYRAAIAQLERSITARALPHQHNLLIGDLALSNLALNPQVNHVVATTASAHARRTPRTLQDANSRLGAASIAKHTACAAGRARGHIVRQLMRNMLAAARCQRPAKLRLAIGVTVTQCQVELLAEHRRA